MSTDTSSCDTLQALAKECVHQAFQYEQDDKYLPPEQIDSNELDQILKNRLDFNLSPPSLQVMTTMQRSDWYGSDGMSKAYNFSMKSSFGNQAIEEEERKRDVKAQKVIDAKAKKRVRFNKQNTAAEDDAISRIDPSGSTQKRGGAASLEGASSRKRGKYAKNAGSSSDDEVPSGKGNKKATVLAPDSDDNMEGEFSHSTCDTPPGQSP